MGSLFSSAPNAPYPSTGYPASAFFGATSLQPGGNGVADSPAANPADSRRLLITVAVIVVGGYVVWHLYNR